MINKIFIVYTEHDDGNRVNSVFSSRDEAEKHRDLIKDEVFGASLNGNCKVHFNVWVEEVKVRDKSDSRSVLFCDKTYDDINNPEVIIINDPRYPEKEVSKKFRDLISVQPMTGPTGLIFSMRNKTDGSFNHGAGI